MKTYMVRYTNDCGAIYHTELISAPNFTDAYLTIYNKIPKEYEITDLFEVI